jgi:5,5'-dehydrodivanillate O-demethylase
LTHLEYEERPFGIMRKMITADGYAQEDPLIFPNMLRRMTELTMKVPIDDTHTKKIVVFVEMNKNGHVSDDEAPDYYLFPMSEGKSVPDAVYPDTTYRMDDLRFQDQMAIESQGRISPRDSWHPATGDRGVAFFDRLLLREIDRVQQGLDPLGLYRDPDRVVDTNFSVLEDMPHNTRGAQGVQTHSRRRQAAVSP